MSDIEFNISTLEVETGRWDDFRNRAEAWDYVKLCAESKDGLCYSNSDTIDWLRSDVDPDALRPQDRDFLTRHFQLRWPVAKQGQNDVYIALSISAQDTVSQVDFADIRAHQTWHRPAFLALRDKLLRINGSSFFNYDSDIQASVQRALQADGW